MTASLDFLAATRWLEQSRSPLLVSHRRPDGDALGSLAAMSLALRQRGHGPTALLFEPLPRRYAFLEPLADWRLWDEQASTLAGAADGVVILDTCSLSQLEPIADFLACAPRTLVVDHHATRDPLGLRDGDLLLIDEAAGANCLILAEWFAAAGIRLEPRLALALLTGIATDCGWFRFSNTDARMLRAAAELVAAGAEPARLYAHLYQQEPLARLKLVARVLDSLTLFARGRLAVMTLRPADFDAAGADPSMTEDLVNEAGRLAGAEATILFTEEEGVIRVNLRSRQVDESEPLDVAQIARRYGGGGHARAAGARVRGEWERVVPRIVAEVEEALG